MKTRDTFVYGINIGDFWRHSQYSRGLSCVVPYFAEHRYFNDKTCVVNRAYDRPLSLRRFTWM